jgi:hypothetical protein
MRYWHEIRPAPTKGALAMDKIFGRAPALYDKYWTCGSGPQPMERRADGARPTCGMSLFRTQAKQQAVRCYGW